MLFVVSDSKRWSGLQETSQPTGTDGRDQLPECGGGSGPHLHRLPQTGWGRHRSVVSNNPKDNVLANRLLIMYMYMEKNFHTLNIRELSLDDIEELVHVPVLLYF